jgi:hypothetical protein
MCGTPDDIEIFDDTFGWLLTVISFRTPLASGLRA